MDSNLHEGCFQFQKDFDTQKWCSVPFARFVLGNGDVVRIVLTPQGVKMYVSRTAVDQGFLVLGPRIEDNLIFAGTPK